MELEGDRLSCHSKTIVTKEGVHLQGITYTTPQKGPRTRIDNSGLPTTKPRGREPQEVTKEVVGIHVLLIRSLFGDSILRRLLRRVSLAKPTSAPLLC